MTKWYIIFLRTNRSEENWVYNHQYSRIQLAWIRYAYVSGTVTFKFFRDNSGVKIGCGHHVLQRFVFKNIYTIAFGYLRIFYVITPFLFLFWYFNDFFLIQVLIRGDRININSKIIVVKSLQMPRLISR
jgi:hypothetical protein